MADKKSNLTLLTFLTNIAYPPLWKLISNFGLQILPFVPFLHILVALLIFEEENKDFYFEVNCENFPILRYYSSYPPLQNYLLPFMPPFEHHLFESAIHSLIWKPQRHAPSQHWAHWILQLSHWQCQLSILEISLSSSPCFCEYDLFFTEHKEEILAKCDSIHLGSVINSTNSTEL